VTAALTCREFVDHVTAYLDRAMARERLAQVDDHLATCDGCRTVLAQWRTVIDLAGQLTDRDIERTGDESASIRRSVPADPLIQRRCKWLR
jgi:predicted anti-sigma-YlaC factor YlaD